MATHGCNPGAGEVESGGSLGFILPYFMSPRPVRDSIFKHQSKGVSTQQIVCLTVSEDSRFYSWLAQPVIWPGMLADNLDPTTWLADAGRSL